MPGWVLMDNRFELIKLLSDGALHSGEVLAQCLQVSRAAVWKLVKKIGEETGLEITAVPGKGYILSRHIELLSRQRIEEALSSEAKLHLSELHIHQVIESTNSWLIEQAGKAAPSGLICLAEQQLAGKGRRGRNWVSPYGSNVYLSLLWRTSLSPSEIAGLSLAAGLGILRSLRGIDCPDVGMKWPNDVLCQGRKIAGLLLEISGESAGPSTVVIGVGINGHLGRHGLSIDQPWTDLSSIPGMKPYSRNSLAASVIKELLNVVYCYEKSGLQSFREEWCHSDLFLGREVALHSASQKIVGTHSGIDEVGGLILDIGGKHKSFYAGEVSLRTGV